MAHPLMTKLLFHRIDFSHRIPVCEPGRRVISDPLRICRWFVRMDMWILSFFLRQALLLDLPPTCSSSPTIMSPACCIPRGSPWKNWGSHESTVVRSEQDHRKIWRLFCENFHLFLGTPSGIWLTHELSEVFEVNEKPMRDNADRLYDVISEKLASPTLHTASIVRALQHPGPVHHGCSYRYTFSPSSHSSFRLAGTYPANLPPGWCDQS